MWRQECGLKRVLGMINIVNLITVKAVVSMQARVALDADISAERVIIMNRTTAEVYYNYKLALPLHTFVVPYIHADANTLVVGILDDEQQYDCKFTDGVMPEKINVNAP